MMSNSKQTANVDIYILNGNELKTNKQQKITRCNRGTHIGEIQQKMSNHVKSEINNTCFLRRTVLVCFDGWSSPTAHPVSSMVVEPTTTII